MENVSVHSTVSSVQTRLPAKSSRYFAFTFLLFFFIYFVSVTATAFMLKPVYVGFEKHNTPLPAPGSWVLSSSVNNVNFYYMMAPCAGRNTVFLKFENKNKYAVNISYVENFQTQQLGNVNGFYGVKQLQLNASETLSASSCTDAQKACIILPEKVSPAYLAVVLNFAFKDVTVTKAN